MRLQDFLANELLVRIVGGATLDFSPVVGQNTFVGYMPSGLQEGLLFAATMPLVKNHYSNLFNGSAQIIFRASTYDKADLIMRQISVIFNDWEFGTVSADGVRVLRIQPRTEPLAYPRQGTGGYEASVNFDVTCAFQV